MNLENTHCSHRAASSSEQVPELVVPALLGPTASGKSALALQLAGETGWEIVSCDSRQIYRGMDIGTAKPLPEERRQVPHWLMDLIDPSEQYSARRFAREAEAVVRARAAAGKQVLICGGTGLYFRALAEGLTEIAASDPLLRAELMERAEVEGTASLHRELSSIDPHSAQRIHEHDLQRIVRAIAVFRQTGKPVSSFRAPPRPASDIRFRVAILDMPRLQLYERINRRVDAMVTAGLRQEFDRLRAASFDRTSPGLQSVGYRELFDVEEGKTTFDEAVELIKRNSRRYAKRQMTWFTHQTRGRRFEAPAVTKTLLDYFMNDDPGY